MKYFVLTAEYEDGSIKTALVDEDEYNEAEEASDFFTPTGLANVTVEGEAKIDTACSLDSCYYSA